MSKEICVSFVQLLAVCHKGLLVMNMK